jgi:acyl-coenzyme A thioesterase PaaI-like protein
MTVGGAQLTCSLEELQSAMIARIAESARLISDLPAYASDGPRSTISALDPGRLQLTTRWDPNAVRPGGTWSGPSQFEIVDTAGFLLTIAHLTPGSDALTISLGMQFLQPPPPGDLLAEARLLRLSPRAAVITVELRAPSVTGPVAHGTVSYACRPANGSRS